MKFEDAIAEIKTRIDIARVIGQYVALKKSGNNWTGLCPFHDEKTPSFHVRSDKGYFKCFGCGAAGDVFSFLEKQTGQLFADIARKLADEAGVIIDASPKSDQEKKQIDHRDRLLKCLLTAHEYFKTCLKSRRGDALPLAYLMQERKFSPDLIASSQLGFGGYDDKDMVEFFSKNQIPTEDALELGLLRQGTRGVYSFFNRRIVVPVLNHRGHLVGFGGRAFGSFAENKPKYINSPSSLVYDKSKVLYGLFESLPLLKQGGPVVIVEGYFDVMAILDVGFAAVAPCGTSLTDEHVKLLSRFSKHVVLCLDQDKAGRAAHDKALMMLLKAGFQVRAAQINDKDPDALWRSGQKEILRRALANAPDAIDALIRDTATKSLVGVAERIASIASLLPFLGASPSPLVNRQYVRLASEILKEDESLLLREVGKLSPLGVVTSGRAQPKRPKKEPAVRWTDAEKLLLSAVICHPQALLRYENLSLAELNSELSGFLLALRKKWADDPGLAPDQVLRSVPVVRDSLIVAMLIESDRYENLISEEEAHQIMEGFCFIEAQQKQRDRIGKNHENLRQAEKRGDLALVRQALQEQSKTLQGAEQRPKKMVEPKAVKEKVHENKELWQNFAKKNEPREQEWDDDEGWT